MHNGLVHRYIYMYELSMSVWLLLRALECNGESKLLFDETMPVFCASLQSAGRNISFLFIMITKPSSLFSNSLILRATGKNTMYQLYALWFGPTRNWSHDFRTRGNYVNHYTPPRWLMSSETFIRIHVQKNNSLANTCYFSMYKIKQNKPFVIHFSCFARSKEND